MIKKAEKSAGLKIETTAPQRPRRKRVTFRLDADKGSDAYVAGSFNNWDAVSHPLKRRPGRSNIHAATVLLSPGRHEYKFIVNGQWLCDPACEHRVSSGLGTMNSVVEVV